MSNENETTTAGARTQNNITIKGFLNGGIEPEFSTAYEAALKVTDKATRHLAVDTSAKHARAAQRAFAGWVNRLTRLLARDFAGATFSVRFVNGGDCGAALRKDFRDEHKTLAAQIWIIRDNKIVRDFVVAGAFGNYAKVFVRQSEYAHPGAAWDSRKTTVKVCSIHTDTRYAAKLVRETPMHVYSAVAA